MTEAEIGKLKLVLEEQLRKLRETAVVENVSSAGGPLADENDRATAESDVSFELRLKDRNRKLAAKITETLAKIENGSYGICESCEEEIDFRRLLARPVTNLCIGCKTEMEAVERAAQIAAA